MENCFIVKNYIHYNYLNSRWCDYVKKTNINSIYFVFLIVSMNHYLDLILKRVS